MKYSPVIKGLEYAIIRIPSLTNIWLWRKIQKKGLYLEKGHEMGRHLGGSKRRQMLLVILRDLPQ